MIFLKKIVIWLKSDMKIIQFYNGADSYTADSTFPKKVAAVKHKL
jgi:hypothetical protein